MRTTYRLTWPSGSRLYFRLKRDAAKRFAVGENFDPETGCDSFPVEMAQVIICEDAFEKAVNGEGGFEESEKILLTRA